MSPADYPRDLLAHVVDDGRNLLLAAEADWSRPVPHCPGWNTADLVGHTGGILAWIATIITTGARVSRRDREAAPADREELAPRGALPTQLRIADAVTKFAGSVAFVYVHILAFAVWMLWIEKSPEPLSKVRRRSGELLPIDHVRSSDASVASWQDRVIAPFAVRIDFGGVYRKGSRFRMSDGRQLPPAVRSRRSKGRASLIPRRAATQDRADGATL